jgi:hypothetical protein
VPSIHVLIISTRIIANDYSDFGNCLLTISQFLAVAILHKLRGTDERSGPWIHRLDLQEASMKLQWPEDAPLRHQCRTGLPGSATSSRQKQ